MSRTRKKPYSKSKAVDRTCHNHGSCPWCEVSRTYNARKTDLFSRLDLKEHETTDITDEWDLDIEYDYNGDYDFINVGIDYWFKMLDDSESPMNAQGMEK